MNTLFCIEKNCSFKPLRDFATRYAEDLLGEIHQIHFINTDDSLEYLSKNLNYLIQNSNNILILSPKIPYKKSQAISNKNSILKPYKKKISIILRFFIASSHCKPSPKIPPNTLWNLYCKRLKILLFYIL